MNGLSGLFTAWQLFLRKPGAISGLDNKVDTAKFSFRAAFYAFPFYWLIVGIGPEAVASTRSLLQTTLIYAVFYFLIWTMWPLVMWHLSRLVNKRDRFFRYLAAYNWSMVVQAAIWLASSAIILGFGLTGSAARITTALTICILCSITFIYYGKGSNSASGRQPPSP